MMAAVDRDEPDCPLYRVTRSPQDADVFLLYEEYVRRRRALGTADPRIAEIGPRGSESDAAAASAV